MVYDRDYLFDDETNAIPESSRRIAQETADYMDVLSKPSGRRVLRSILSFLRGGRILSMDASIYANAALNDAAQILESQFWDLAPDGWAEALKEEINERRNAPKEK